MPLADVGIYNHLAPYSYMCVQTWISIRLCRCTVVPNSQVWCPVALMEVPTLRKAPFPSSFCPLPQALPVHTGGKPGMPCSTCPHPTCKHSVRRQGIFGCPECDEGTVFINEANLPRLKIECNHCHMMLTAKGLVKEATSIDISICEVSVRGMYGSCRVELLWRCLLSWKAWFHCNPVWMIAVVGIDT